MWNQIFFYLNRFAANLPENAGVPVSFVIILKGEQYFWAAVEC